MSSTIFNRFRPRAAEAPVVEVEQKKDTEAVGAGPTEKEGGFYPSEGERSDSDSEQFTPEAQDGVKGVEALTTVWTKQHLIIAYVMIWIIYFIDTLQQGMTNNLTTFVTSSFNQHSLLAATSIMSNIIGGLIKLPLAKVLDIWGRPHGYLLMIFILTIGLIMMAACNNVKTYAAAQVFYWVGYNGLTYTLGIFIADTSKLKNRGIMLAYASSPYIITTWIGGPLANAVLKGPGWRWGFGAFAIVTPVVTLPLFFLFWHNYKKAVEQGLITKTPSGRTMLQSLKHYSIEFDLFGLLLIIAGFALFLLPFSLYSYQAKGWQSPMIICMIIFGGLFLIAFVFYEKYFAPKTFIPFELLLDRTVVCACILAASLFVSFFIWNAYFYSFLLVVNNQTITQASYILNIYSIGSCLFSIVVGFLIRWSGRIKWIALYFGVPVTILGVGLMIHFRQPDVHIGYVVMCQIFIAFSGGACVIAEQMIAMAVTSHQYVAVVLAVEGMFSSIGGAIGSTVAAAIWTGVFPKKLAEYLPAEELANLPKIYGDIRTQLEYLPGTAARRAINQAYGDAQKDMVIGATAVLAIGLVATALWRDVKVKDFKQVKGTVI